MKELHIQIIAGDRAPVYDTGYETEIIRVTITEQATQANLPIVDFIAEDKEGEKIMFVITGRQVCALATMIRDINERNHGQPEP